MANSYPQGPPGTYPPSYSGGTPTVARRTSYASIVSGATNVPNPAHQQPTRASWGTSGAALRSSGHSPHSYPSQTSQYLHRAPETSHSYNSGMQAPESWERRQSQHYTSSFCHFGEGSGLFTAESRQHDFFVPSYLQGSRYVEKLEEKYRTKSSTHRDGRSGRSSIGGSLSTSGSSMNLHKMVPSHRGMTYEIQEKPSLNTEEVLLPLPSRWSLVDKYSGLEVLGDGSEIKFNGGGKTTDEAAAVRADHPVPKQCGIYYYEVTILSKGKDCPIGIGLSGSKVVLNRQPGWEPESWAYHGDDGFSFCQTCSGKSFGPKFGYLDIIGCGINFATGCAFYTKNGSLLGTAFKEIKVDNLYPTVGMKKATEHIKVNFGQSPFVFDIDSMVKRERETLKEQIEFENTESLRGKNKDEATLLQELVAQYLAHDGFTETAKAFEQEVQSTSSLLHQDQSSSRALEYKEDLDAINRQRIRAAILDGDIDKALKQTKAYFPLVLLDNENIYFKLRCRKFIEMIRRCTLLQPRSKRSSTSNTTATNGHAKALQDDYNDVFDGRMELDEPLIDADELSGDVFEAQNGGPSDLVARQNELMVQALQYGQELRAEFKDDVRVETRKELEATFALVAYPDARDSSLAPLLEVAGRVPVAEELSAAILVSLGKLSSAALERLVQQTEVLVGDLAMGGSAAAFVNVKGDYMR